MVLEWDSCLRVRRSILWPELELAPWYPADDLSDVVKVTCEADAWLDYLRHV